MPSNIISINGVPGYNVPDRKMEELIQWLMENAFLREEVSPEEISTEGAVQGQV